MAIAVSVSDPPTAEEDPEASNVLWVANQPVPGICLPMDGERRRKVDHKAPKGGSRDLLVDQGLEPTEVTVQIKTTNGEVYRALYDFYLKYMDPDRALTRLNIVTVAHPQLYTRGIKLGYFYSAPLAKPTEATGIRPYIHEFKFRIVGPKTQINAASGSSKPNTSTAVGGPTDPNFKAKTGVLGAVGIIGEKVKLLPGISLFTGGTAPVPPPAAQPVQMLTPAQLKQVGDAGDTAAKFVSGLLDQAAPR